MNGIERVRLFDLWAMLRVRAEGTERGVEDYD